MIPRPNAGRVVILHKESPSKNNLNLCRILEFFGIPFEMRCLSELHGIIKLETKPKRFVIFGSIDIFDELREQFFNKVPFLESIAAIYLYGAENISNCKKSLQLITGFQNGALEKADGKTFCIEVSTVFPELSGPFTGMQVSIRPGEKDFIFHLKSGSSQFTSIISDGDKIFFFLTHHNEIPYFITTSSHMPDLDAPIPQGYYDVKSHFCSAVPLMMFLKYAFAEAIWQPVEHGACLIIDDPLLKPRYGFCDFRILLHQMKSHGFTTDISFIPWNWWRTTKKDGSFFRRESSCFSVSIHGCDHIAAEFGSKNFADLATRAILAKSRMQFHAANTGIRHDPIMVFPQGIFSHSCLEALKETGYIAAVNTEVSPSGHNTIDVTHLRDVWNVAITRYSFFPIFTRRYAHHGLENFAFDLLLGKPCLIVAHHEFFKNEGEAVIELVKKLSSLHCNLTWRPLGEVLRRACRYRLNDSGLREYWMYAGEIWIENDGHDAVIVTVRKKEDNADLIAGIESCHQEIEWKIGEGYVEFSTTLAGKEKRLFKVDYKDQHEFKPIRRNLKYELKVAARRILSELRDEGMYQQERLWRVLGRRRRKENLTQKR